MATSAPDPRHQPVLLAEALEQLEVKPGGFYVDGTVGLGGHAEAILERCAPDGRLLGTDRDAEALERSRERLARFGERCRLVHDDFRSLPERLEASPPDGILLDLGVSSLQLDAPERGFSFRTEGPLDMRMDRSSGATAEELIAGLDEGALADLIYELGEERASRRIARAIVWERDAGRLHTTTDLAEAVRRAAGRGPRRPARGRPRLDPATRTFQALRIAVNRELEGLGAVLRALAHRLAPGGRLVVISFHSLEDREAKQTLRELRRAGGFAVLTPKPVRPGPAECQANPRARSARLRAVARLADAEAA